MALRILLSAYRCSPYDVSEAYAAFCWLDILLKRYSVTLLTTVENEKGITNYYNPLPENLTIISFKDNYPLKSNSIIRNGVKLGYFIFNNRLKGYLKQHADLVQSADVLFHKSPMSFRYLSCLSAYDKPFVFGPIGGGLKPHPQLKSFFKGEGLLYKLRNIDQYILQLPAYRLQFERSRAILITLEYVKDIIEEKYHSKMVEIFDTGIDCQLYKKDPAQQETENFTILFVGRLVKYKGAELLVKAIHQLKVTRRLKENIFVHLVGSGAEEETLQNLVNQYQLGDTITFFGNISKEEVKSHYQESSLFCYPSLKEASGNALLEAMSFELPIITIDNGGPKYMCPDQGAIKIPITDEITIVNEIANSILKLYEDKELANRMGKLNREYCIEEYDWHALEKKIYSFFDAIQDDKQP